MIDLTKIDQLAERLGALLPPGAQQFRGDLEAQFRTVLRSALGKMDLVSREDFEIQKAALERATATLKDLEQRLQDLEEA